MDSNYASVGVDSRAEAGTLYGGDPVIRGNSIYTVASGPSWTKAEANAQKVGGHLVTINDSEENSFVGNTFGADVWIGLTDAAKDGEWVWSSGQQNITCQVKTKCLILKI